MKRIFTNEALFSFSMVWNEEGVMVVFAKYKTIVLQTNLLI